ncbi:hypothetical protein Tco_1484557 [Tanacetum coccineum]
MFHKKNVDSAVLIWEDFQYQIDNRQSKNRRREIMPYHRITKIIINYFLSQHKSIPKRQGSYVNTIKDDGVLGRLKFVSKGEDYQVYGTPIPYVMVKDEIKISEAYQNFIALSTGLIPPKKSRRKVLKGKKATVTPKKKSSITADDNILQDPDEALKLGKSISKTEVEIAEEERLVHEIHERLVTEKPTSIEESDESDGEPTNRPTGKRRPIEEQLATDIIQAIKASRKVNKIQPQTRGSSEGVGITPEVPDESKGKSTTSSEGFGIKPKVKLNGLRVMMKKIHDDDDKSIDIEETKDNERIESNNDDYVMDDAEKDYADKAEGEQDAEEEPPIYEQDMDDQGKEDQVGVLINVAHKEKPDLLLSTSSQSLSSSYGNQFCNLSSDISLTTPTPLPPLPSSSKAPTVTTVIPDPLPAIHDDHDEDPSGGSNQGKNTKRRITKESKQSNKSSTSKETSKGNTPPKASKTDKSVNAKEIVAEPTDEVTMDAEENIVFDMRNVDEQSNGAAAPQDDAAPRNDNSNWFK